MQKKLGWADITKYRKVLFESTPNLAVPGGMTVGENAAKQNSN